MYGVADTVRDDAHGVDGLRVQLRHIRMLRKRLLQHVEALFLQIGQQLLRIRPVRRAELLDAVAAGAAARLGEEAVQPLQECGQLVRRCRGGIQRPAAEEIGKADIETELIIELITIAGLIHQFADLFVAHARQIGVALLAVHVVEAEHHIVIVPCAVARRAPENVAERARLAVAALLLDNAHDVVQLFKADAAQHAGDIFDPGHMIPLPSVFFPKQYHTIILRKNLLLF